MDTDITPIFEPHNDPPQQPQQQMVPADDDESTPLEYVQQEHGLPEPQHSYVHPQPPAHSPYYYPPQAPVQPQHVPPAPPQQYDPFKNISTSTWIILAVAFVLGFFIGKYK